MEAMAAGKPILVSDVRGNHELCEFTGGEIFDLRKENGAADALKKMLSRRKEWPSMGAFNREKMKEYDQSAVEAIMRRVYSDCAGL
jgi:glycosyltransferase involved in cell wall biosynthesis